MELCTLYLFPRDPTMFDKNSGRYGCSYCWNELNFVMWGTKRNQTLLYSSKLKCKKAVLVSIDYLPPYTVQSVTTRVSIDTLVVTSKF